MSAADRGGQRDDRTAAIDRREALRRATLLLGGALSAPAIAGVVAGCEPRAADAGAPSGALSASQLALVAAIVERILPATDTPGARAANVHRFVDRMLAEYYDESDRARFAEGLADVDARARRAHGRRFLEIGDAEQHAILAELDREAFASADARAVPFIRTIKELTVLGYYTSRPGATRELRHEPVPGRYDGCVPLASVGRSWAV